MNASALGMVLIFVIFLCVLLAGALVYACKRIERLEELSREEAIGDATGVYEVVHAKCIAHIASYVGNEFAAQVLEAAAKDFDSVEGQADKSRIAATAWEKDGPSVPSIWLVERANNLRHDQPDTIYNFAGERVL